DGAALCGGRAVHATAAQRPCQTGALEPRLVESGTIALVILIVVAVARVPSVPDQREKEAQPRVMTAVATRKTTDPAGTRDPSSSSSPASRGPPPPRRVRCPSPPWLTTGRCETPTGTRPPPRPRRRR